MAFRKEVGHADHVVGDLLGEWGEDWSRSVNCYIVGVLDDFYSVWWRRQVCQVEVEEDGRGHSSLGDTGSCVPGG